ncbi:MAG: hypothetical protein HY260_14710, partial [Chloroflexi bacterium]|nr:hypothetical protein [Chloroflexota bacterium]
MVAYPSSLGARHTSPLVNWALFIAHCSLIVLFFWRHIFTRLILAHGDTFLLFYPTWDYRAAALRAGRIPLWNPVTFMGAPFLANSQYGVLYPLNWPLAWLSAPAAIKVAILFHLALGALGAYLFARRVLALKPLSAWFAAALFALGGYLTAHVELVNQLQGLAWLPWIFWATDRAGERPRRYFILLTFFIALQLLAGHTQTTFITLVGAMTYSFVSGWLAFRVSRIAHDVSRSPISLLKLFFLLPASFLLASLLSAAQLLPTLELSRQSLRAEGLPVHEALSFSLDPRLIGLSLLPGYSRALFSEYVGAIGVTGLCLILVALINLRHLPSAVRNSQLAILLVALLGLFFALGRFNPIYAGLARFVPGFNLFRVPARWLALWAFGGAMLAGIGLQALVEARLSWRSTGLVFLAVGTVIGLTSVSTGVTPAGELGPLPAPTLKDALLWIATALVALALLSRPLTLLRAPLLASLALVELFAASRIQPFNQLTVPEAYYASRPSIDFLLASNQGKAPPGRMVAASRLFYDPTMNSVKLSDLPPATRLAPGAAYEYVVASKYKDVLSNNLALTWDIPTLDGYDGGILPLKNFVTFEEYLLGHRPLTDDGRLRENIIQTPADVPDGRALSLANAQYFLADKTFDFWIDG